MGKLITLLKFIDSEIPATESDIFYSYDTLNTIKNLINLNEFDKVDKVVEEVSHIALIENIKNENQNNLFIPKIINDIGISIKVRVAEAQKELNAQEEILFILRDPTTSIEEKNLTDTAAKFSFKKL